MIKVTEQDVSTGSLTQETNYTYDIADRLTLVNQGNQTRAFKYDAEGKLLFERIPEQSATINDGMGTYWSTKYMYTDWGAVATKQDARGVITTYGYDTLHRLTSISYNTASGVTTASTVTNNYDNVQTSTTKGLLLSTAVGSSYSESYSYDGFKRLNATTKVMDGLTYWTGYQYDTANQFTQITYPNGAVINIGHDSKGRLASVGGYLTSVTYSGIGQMTGTTLGNGVSEIYGYDPNRMQLTSQTATKSGGPTNGLMNLTYSYQASAGQMGAGTTAGNAGQLMSISGTIGAVTESAAYSYDNLGRLVTSNQTSNGSSAQRRFAYDRWGNRTGMWDAVSGGTQIQSITLQQSGGAPTNRITSVTSGGSTLNYLYDPAGNVTNDGVHGYGYDSENRIVSVDGGSTATYAYDQSNQRYKKVVGSTITHYIWQGSQVIAEHNGSTGAVLIDCVYSGSRMIAKVASGITQYFLSDRLSARLVLDSSGNVIGRQGHLPFGEDFGESGTQEKHHFTSYERDGEGTLDYAINRADSSSVGRFMQADPYRPSGYIVDPQSWNRYRYARNDPANKTDRLGLEEGGTPWDYNPDADASQHGFSDHGFLGLNALKDLANEPGYQRPPQIPGASISLMQGIAAATAALKNASQECKDLFNGQDPSALLAKLQRDGRISYGSSYLSYDRASGSNVTKEFPTFPDGSIAAGITSSFRMPDGSIQSIVTFRTGGAFFTLTVRVTDFITGRVSEVPLSSFSGFGGLTPDQLRGVIILHELRHVAGVTTDDHSDSNKNWEFTKEVAQKCFNGK